jgi:hypothetical protein
MFESTDFALSDEGIHLLRNRFNYKTISFQDLDKATIKKDVVTNRLVLTLTVGFLLILFAVFQSITVYESFIDPLVKEIYIESIVLPVLPLLIGVYCIYISVKKVPTLLVEKDGKKYKLRLNEIIKNQQLANLQAYLRTKLTINFFIQEL